MFNMDNVTVLSALAAAVLACFLAVLTFDITKKIQASLRTTKTENHKSADTHSKADQKVTLDIRVMIHIEQSLIAAHLASVATSLLFVSDDLTCLRITKLALALYHLSGITLYLFFIRRIHIVYKDTFFALSTHHLCTLYTSIALYTSTYIGYVDLYRIQNIHFDAQFGCVITSHTSLPLFIPSLIKILFAIYSLLLFLRPMHIITRDQPDKQISSKIYAVMIKYAILFTSAIISSLIMLLISIFMVGHNHNFAVLDSLITGLVLMLLNPIHNRAYKRLCCCAHACCMLLSHAPTQDEAMMATNLQQPPEPLEALEASKVSRSALSLASAPSKAQSIVPHIELPDPDVPGIRMAPISSERPPRAPDNSPISIRATVMSPTQSCVTDGPPSPCEAVTPVPDVQRPSSISTTTAQMIDLSKITTGARLERVAEMTVPEHAQCHMELPKQQGKDVSLSMPVAISLTLSKTMQFITYESSQL